MNNRRNFLKLASLGGFLSLFSFNLFGKDNFKEVLHTNIKYVDKDKDGSFIFKRMEDFAPATIILYPLAHCCDGLDLKGYVFITFLVTQNAVNCNVDKIIEKFEYNDNKKELKLYLV